MLFRKVLILGTIATISTIASIKQDDYKNLMKAPENELSELASMMEVADDMSRLKRVWFIEHNLIKCFPTSHMIWKEYKEMLRDYLGLRHYTEYSDKETYNSDYFDMMLIKALQVFEEMDDLSPVVTYMFDRKIDFLHSFKNDIFHKNDLKKIAQMVALGYICMSILPGKHSPSFNKFQSHGGNETIWNSIVSSFKIICAEIGFSNNGAAYEWFDKTLAQKLSDSKTYIMYISGGDCAFEYLSDSHKMLEEKFDSIAKEYSKKNSKNAQISHLSDDLKQWIHNEKSVNHAIKFLLDKDTLFTLTTLGNLGSKNNIYNANMDNVSKAILSECSSMCRFLVDEVCKFCSCKTIKWGSMPVANIDSEKIDGILRSIAYFGNLDVILGHLFGEKYSRDTESLMSMMTNEIDNIK